MGSVDEINALAMTGDEIELIKKHLEKVLSSKYFKSAKQMKRFLTYIVEKTIAGEEKLLKQYTIGVEALSLSDDFNPDENPAVRILGGRVRQRLIDYYSDVKDSDEIIISMPKGSYIPEFKKKADDKKNIAVTLTVSRGPTLALASFSDKTQNKKTNRLLLELTDTLATELSRFLLLQLVVCNPYGDKELSYEVDVDMKSTNRANYVLALYFQEINADENKYRLIYRLVLVDTGEIIWSENYVVSGQPLEEQEYIIGKISATVTDTLQGVMHTHWSRNLLTNIDTIPDYYKVLVHYRSYTDSFSREDFTKGVSVCLEALKRNSNDIIAHMVLASYCRRDFVHGREIIELPLEKAQECIEIAIRHRPNSHEIRYVYGLILFNQNHWERSIEEFALARSISKNHIVTEFGIGFHLCKMNQWEKGLELINKAMLLSSNYPSNYHLVPCLDLYRQGKYQQALAEAKRITVPSLIHGSLARCVSYAQLGRMEEAKTEFDEVLNRCPNFMQKGRVHLRRYLGAKTLSDKVWDGVLKVVNSLE